MHLSQSPWPSNWTATEPQPYLLATSGSNPCASCHTNTQDGETIVTVGPPGGESYIPIVYNSAVEPTKPLAGGNFYWMVKNNDDTLGHNAKSVIPDHHPDSNLTTTPGTMKGSTCGACHDSSMSDTTPYPDGNYKYLDCVFCHAAKGAHHADDSATVVGETGKWYRYLNFDYFHPRSFVEGLGFCGVEGIEDPDWEQNASSGVHNEYAGDSGSTPSHSISKYCACCHGLFHGTANTGSDSPFIRHPTDFAIPNFGEYAEAFNASGGTGTYNPLTPIARDPSVLIGMSGPSPTVTLGSDQVQCLSCHRPHGSPYPDMLRWNYEACQAGTSNSDCGCFVCHTKKD